MRFGCFDGEDPETLSASSAVVSTSSNWYSGETLELLWDDNPSSNTEYERLAFTVGPTTLVRAAL